MRERHPLEAAAAPCPGRVTECEKLDHALLETREGHGGAWLVTGPQGIGKTYLLAWAGRRAASLGLGVVSVSCPRRTEVPYGALETVRRALQTRAVMLSSPGSRLLGYVNTLLQVSAERPLVVLLDDLHHADPESILAFQVLSRALGGMACLLVGAIRDADLPGEPTGTAERWERTIRALRQEGSLQSLPLSGLDAATCRWVVESVAGAPLAVEDPDGLVRVLRGRTFGNPLLLRELTLLLLSQGILQVDSGSVRAGPAARPLSSGAAGRWWESLPYPPTMRRLLLSRLDPVLPADLQVLRFAALVGSPFDAASLAPALGRSRRDLEGTFADLERRGILRRVSGEGPDSEAEGWGFVHDALGEVLLRELPAAQVRELALRLANAWASYRPDEVETVARFFHAAAEPGEGLRWVRDAIDRALAAGNTASAERGFEWYFDLLSVATDRVEERTKEALELVDRLLVRRLRRETLGVLQQLTRTHPSETLSWEAGWREVHVLLSFDAHEAEERLARLERRMLPSGGDFDRRRGELAFLRCEMAGAVGDWVQVRARAEEAQRLLGAERASWLSGRILHETAWAALMEGNFEETHRLLREARPFTQSEEAPTLGSSFLVLEGSLLLMEGKLAEAERAYQEAARRLLQLGGLEGYGVALNNLAEVAVHRGDRANAERYLADAEVVAVRFDYPRVRQGWATKRAWLYALFGEWSRAQEMLAELGRNTGRTAFSEEEHEVELLRAWVLGETGAPAAGLRALAPLLRKPELLQPHFRPYLELVHGRLLLLAKEPGAVAALEKGLELARAWGAAEVVHRLQQALEEACLGAQSRPSLTQDPPPTAPSGAPSSARARRRSPGASRAKRPQGSGKRP